MKDMQGGRGSDEGSFAGWRKGFNFASHMTNQPKRYLIRAALPYANGLKHIRHQAGSYLAGDNLLLFMRAQIEEVAYICCNEEHGKCISIQAIKGGATSSAFIDK